MRLSLGGLWLMFISGMCLACDSAPVIECRSSAGVMEEGCAAITPMPSAVYLYHYTEDSFRLSENRLRPIVRNAVLADEIKAPEQQRHPPCDGPDVSIDTQPTEATLTWPSSGKADHYFIQYSNGKFPTQITVPGGRRGEKVDVKLSGLRPGATYRVEICEARGKGICPGGPPPDSCTRFIDVSSPRSYPGVQQPDPKRAVCSVVAGSIFLGDPPGYPFDYAQPAAIADACCQACANLKPSLPYQDQCLFWVFESRTGKCHFKKNLTGQQESPGAVSGRVVAWPKDDGRR